MAKVIEVNHISKSFKKQQVLHDVSLSCESGKIYGIVGYNGSGKSVLFKCICGYYRVDEGSILVRDQKIGVDVDMIRNAGIIIEEPAFLKQYSGLKNLDFLYRLNHKPDREHLRQAMEQVGLDPGDKRTYKKYSLGMKQKLGIAAAFMEKPDIIILDEPINALDEAGAKQVHKILEEQKKRGALIIIACHDKEELEMLSDEIIEIYEGRIVAGEKE